MDLLSPKTINCSAKYIKFNRVKIRFILMGSPKYWALGRETKFLLYMTQKEIEFFKALQVRLIMPFIVPILASKHFHSANVR